MSCAGLNRPHMTAHPSAIICNVPLAFSSFVPVSELPLRIERGDKGDSKGSDACDLKMVPVHPPVATLIQLFALFF